ncbi:hypothetical protein [Roseiarcus sp.]|uniref:hypothetical protein n=1 Tax=Roseiarcus sp. TaxID=1969460 RepID=UPI003F9E3EDF
MRRSLPEGREFEDLLSHLASIVSKAELGAIQLNRLRAGVTEAIYWYGSSQFTSDLVAKTTLHKVAKSLARVIEALRDEGNEHPLLMALGQTPEQSTVDLARGIERLQAVIADLEKIAAIPPERRPRGRTENRDLHHLVHRLANLWLVVSGTSFTQMWANDGAATNGAAFIEAVVTFVDPQNLKALPKMAERVVKERRSGKVMP